MTDGTSSATPDATAPAGAPGSPEPNRVEQPPRPGELTFAWRIVTVATWITVVAAFAAVWNTSVQLGLRTWWLGPRSEPRPIAIRLLPFVPSVLIVLATINRVRRSAVLGLLGAAYLAVIGVVDLGYVRRLGFVELAIAVAAALVSVASFTGTYRAATPPAG